MGIAQIDLRPAGAGDLEAINAVIEAAVMTWNLPPRVKRLALSSYRYGEADLEAMALQVAIEGDRVIGIVAWEPADPGDAPGGASALLLHGLYVDPGRQGLGVGTRLVEAAEAEARARGLDGLLVKAQRGAEPFFLSRGLLRIPPLDTQRDYPNRLWKPSLSTTPV